MRVKYVLLIVAQSQSLHGAWFSGMMHEYSLALVQRMVNNQNVAHIMEYHEMY